MPFDFHKRLAFLKEETFFKLPVLLSSISLGGTTFFVEICQKIQNCPIKFVYSFLTISSQPTNKILPAFCSCCTECAPI